MFQQIEWLFFDVGSTLVDESRANEHRIRDAIAGTEISYDQACAKAVRLATIWIRQEFGGMASPSSEEETSDCRVHNLAELQKLLL